MSLKDKYNLRHILIAMFVVSLGTVLIWLRQYYLVTNLAGSLIVMLIIGNSLLILLTILVTEFMNIGKEV